MSKGERRQKRNWDRSVKKQIIEEYLSSPEETRKAMRKEYDIKTSDVMRWKKSFNERSLNISKPSIIIPKSHTPQPSPSTPDREHLINDLYIMIAKKDLMIHRLRAELAKYKPIAELNKEFEIAM